MDKTKTFYELAKKYCKFVTEEEISFDTIPALIEMLINLYICAINLPEPENVTTKESPSELMKIESIRINEQIEPFYWEIYDPFIQEEPVCGYLPDDLIDIANDLLIGISEYDSGRIGNAAFEWKLGLSSHWGFHVVDALRALHSLISI
jgi:hypothetical protein